MVSYGFVFGALCTMGVNADASAGGNNWNFDTMTKQRNVQAGSGGAFTHFDSTYMMALMGTGGKDETILHKHTQLSSRSVALTAMEKVTAQTAVATRASIRKQLVGLLKSQVRIESMYGSKKEKLYLSASSIYNFIATLLHSACGIALDNDVLWKEQMQCFSAYRQLLEIYSMFNGVRDVAFALEHGMSVTEDTLAVCGPNVAYKEHFVSQTSGSGRLQNQYLVATTMRACFDNLQVRIEASRRWLSTLLVSMDSQQDRAQACLFRVITVLTCLSSGNQENVLDLAIKEEHSQHVVYGLARYASIALQNNETDTTDPAPMRVEAAEEDPASFMQMDGLRDARRGAVSV